MPKLVFGDLHLGNIDVQPGDSAVLHATHGEQHIAAVGERLLYHSGRPFEGVHPIGEPLRFAPDRIGIPAGVETGPEDFLKGAGTIRHAAFGYSRR